MEFPSITVINHSSSSIFQVRENCLTFLRIAALLKAHLMEESSPVIADPIAECGALEQYLGVWDTCSVVNSAIMGKI